MSQYCFQSPSPRYQLLSELYRQVHETGLSTGADATKLFAGGSLLYHVSSVQRLARHTQATSILDYGSGKGLLYRQTNLKLPDGQVIPSVKEYWGVDEIHQYDPGVEEFSVRPESAFDGVVSTDVLEHIPEEDIDWVLKECFCLAKRFVYMNIASYPAKKILPNGWNAHVTIKSPDWWRERIEEAAKDWTGSAYLFEVTEKRSGTWGSIIRGLGGGRLKLTRIESWK